MWKCSALFMWVCIHGPMYIKCAVSILCTHSDSWIHTPHQIRACSMARVYFLTGPVLCSLPHSALHTVLRGADFVGNFEWEVCCFKLATNWPHLPHKIQGIQRNFTHTCRACLPRIGITRGSNFWSVWGKGGLMQLGSLLRCGGPNLVLRVCVPFNPLSCSRLPLRFLSNK